MNDILKSTSLLDTNKTIAYELLNAYAYPWEILPYISQFILNLGANLPISLFEKKDSNIWIAKDAFIADSACLRGPLIIDSKAEIRHCAFIRGNVIIGKNTVVGNSTELKNSLLFDGVQVPHFNYVGDSILGYKSHLGAGAITSNVKSDRDFINIRNYNRTIYTDMRKLGAIIGDHSEIGCNAVLNPGTIIGKNSTVYPLSMVRGVIPPDSIYKNNGDIVKKL